MVFTCDFCRKSATQVGFDEEGIETYVCKSHIFKLAICGEHCEPKGDRICMPCGGNGQDDGLMGDIY